ncbi:DinB family protein [Nakamurella lactea]|uniref:DinB family protein n=1 Tax=Nakamurella lactea TaxID=459515 RepID=UPI0004144747|nr:DinB family protein [Nakamurella lactea]
MSTEQTAGLSRERADLLEALAVHRHFLKFTTNGLTDEQARQRTTVSELTLGGLVKHVAEVEASWRDFIVNGPGSTQKDFSEMTAEDFADREAGFRLLPEETLSGVLADYDRVAAATDELVTTVDLDLSHPLPQAPWYEPGARRSARRSLLHIIAETAQHAGHADIIREALDGAKTMG